MPEEQVGEAFCDLLFYSLKSKPTYGSWSRAFVDQEPVPTATSPVPFCCRPDRKQTAIFRGDTNHRASWLSEGLRTAILRFDVKKQTPVIHRLALYRPAPVAGSSPLRASLTIAIVVIWLSIAQGQAVHAQWQKSLGVEGKNMQSLLARGAHTFAGGATGAYVSTNGGRSFLPSNVGNDSVGPTRGFAYTSERVFTCTSQGVFRSSDNGLTWTQKNTGLSDLRTSGILYVRPYLVVVTPVGVFRSLNEGDKWESAGLSGKDIRCLTAIQDAIFVGSNGEGIFKSTDFGINWQAANNGLQTTSVRAIESNGSILFAGGGVGSGVFRSSDLGAQWSLLSNGIPSGSYRGFASNGSFIFAGAFGAGVYFSSDSGDHWTAMNQGLEDLTIFDLELTDGYLVAATNTKGVFHYPLSNLPGFPTQITAQSMTLNGFQITFTSKLGVTHVVQYLDALGNPWGSLQTVSGTGAPMTIIDPALPQPDSRFYRISTP